MPSKNSNEEQFEINLVGDATKEKWFGKFSALRRLPFRAQMTKDRARREYLGALAEYATDPARMQAVVLSDLLVSLVDAPDWWKASSNGQDLSDWNLIEGIWMEVQRIQGNLKKEDDDKTKADSVVLKKAVDNGDAQTEVKGEES